MELWKSLYLLVWLAFAQFLFTFGRIWTAVFLDLHALLGAVILGIAYYNSRKPSSTAAPSRLKRIARTTLGLAALQLILGAVLYAGSRFGYSLPFTDVITLLHLITALAILTQASSTATAYDMWEEKKFAAPLPALGPP